MMQEDYRNTAHPNHATARADVRALAEAAWPEPPAPAPTLSASSSPPPALAPVGPPPPRSYFDLPEDIRRALWTPEAVARLMDRLAARTGARRPTRWDLERPIGAPPSLRRRCPTSWP